MDTVKYEQALREIESIAEKIESGTCEVDELATLVRRAKELIKVCKDKLQKTDEEVRTLLAGDSSN